MADLTKVHSWVTDFLRDTPQAQRFEALAGRIEEALNFMKAYGITPENARPLAETGLYAVMVLYCLAMKNRLPAVIRSPNSMDGMQLRAYGVDCDRTRQPDGAC